jgi:hypothetical protein
LGEPVFGGPADDALEDPRDPALSKHGAQRFRSFDYQHRPLQISTEAGEHLGRRVAEAPRRFGVDRGQKHATIAHIDNHEGEETAWKRLERAARQGLQVFHFVKPTRQAFGAGKGKNTPPARPGEYSVLVPGWRPDDPPYIVIVRHPTFDIAHLAFDAGDFGGRQRNRQIRAARAGSGLPHSWRTLKAFTPVSLGQRREVEQEVGAHAPQLTARGKTQEMPAPIGFDGFALAQPCSDVVRHARLAPPR